MTKVIIRKQLMNQAMYKEIERGGREIEKKVQVESSWINEFKKLISCLFR